MSTPIPNDGIIILQGSSPDEADTEITVEDLYQAFKSRLMFDMQEWHQETMKQLLPKCRPVKPGPDANVCKDTDELWNET